MDTFRTVFPLVVAGIFVYVFARMALGGLRERRWPRSEGAITETRRHRADPDSASFDARVTFRTGDGESVDAWALNHVGYETTREPGTLVTVAYDPREPRRFYVRAPGQQSPGWTIVLAVGVLAFALWVVYVLV